MPYIPPNSQKLSDMPVSQIRLALQGATKTGKTYSALTGTNIVVADFDNGLAAHKSRNDVHRLAFCEDAWLREHFPECCKDSKGKTIAYPARDAFHKWMEKEAPKLEAGQILFIDSWTTVQDAFDMQTTLEPALTLKGEVDSFVFWDRKIDYGRDILSAMKSLKCHVIVSFHEQDVRDASGKLIGKVEPAMQGKFAKKLGLYFTDWFRCISRSKFEGTGEQKKLAGTQYFWQTKGDDEVNLGSRLPSLPMFIEPNFQNLIELYFNQKQQTT